MKLSLKLDNIRLRYKMMIIYIFCVLLPIVLTNIVFYQVTMNNVKSQHMQDLMRALEQVKDEFRREIDDAVRVSSVFNTDYILNEILEREYKSPIDYIAAYDSYLRKILNNYIPSYTFVQSIKIYMDNPTILYAGGIGYLSDKVRNSNWYKELEEAETKGISVVVTRTEKEDNFRAEDNVLDTFSVVRRMNYFNFFGDSKWEKIVKIELRTQAIEQIFSNRNLDGHIYLLNEKDQIEYTTDPNINWQTDTVFFYELSFPKDSIELISTYSGSKYLSDWKLVSVISEEVVFSEIHKPRQLIIWMVLINLLYSTAVIFWVTRSMNVRLVKILRHMEKVKKQEFVPIEMPRTYDEIGELQNEFNRMIMKIKSLIYDVYIADIRQKNLEIEHFKAQLNALQSQINLHFLFNSLETIRVRSLIKKETETARIIHNLAKLLRSSLTWNKGLITVKKELEFINCFLEIQKYRFGDRLNYDIDVDPKALDVVIPKMVFLPFVENASIHGVEPMKDGGEIYISIGLEGNYLQFSVRDNGVGMEAERLEQIYGYLQRNEEIGERVGVQNVIYRLKMLYGDQFQLFIDSAPGKGTLVRITVPIKDDIVDRDIPVQDSKG